MDEESVREYLADFQKRALPVLMERDLDAAGKGKIKAIIGPRRAGKTYFMYQKMGELLLSGATKEGIVYLNLEDPRLMGMDFKEMREVIKLHWQMYPLSKEKLNVFIDEPQNVSGWEAAVRGLHDEGFDIFITGSSSKLLSREIATALRGRSLSYCLLPFSFREFLRCRKFSPDIKRLGSKEKSDLLGLLREYMNFGGFPEVVAEPDADLKMKIIGGYIDLVVYRDIVERYGVKNAGLVKWLIRSSIGSSAKELSVHKIYNTLKSAGIKASKNTLYSYMSMLEDSFFVFLVPKFSSSERKRDLSLSKLYLCDVGYSLLAESARSLGQRMENMIFLELERRRRPLASVSYWKNTQKEEVDFVIKDGSHVSQLIQACYDITDAETKKRKIRALGKASKELGCNNLLVITWDHKGEERIDGKKIEYKPLWEWLLA